MRSKPLLALFALLLAGCPTEEVVEVPDAIWTPALSEDDTGTLDLGEITVRTNIEGEIELENNTEEDMVVTINFDLPSAEGFWGSNLDGSQEATLEAGASFAVQVKLNPPQVMDINGSIDFAFGDRVVPWTVTGTVVE